MTITQLMLERLRMQRARPCTSLEYTIGGSVQTQVDARLNASFENYLAKGEQALHSASHTLQTQHVFASRKGLAKAHFNFSKPTKEITP